VEGVVDHLAVERSFLVAKGDPLVYLEASVERATFERARATAAAEGEVKMHEEKLAHARRMHGRVSELFKSEAISAEKKDEAATEMALSASRLQKAKEDRQLAKLDFERAQAQLEQKVIRSPIAGVVVERLVAPGEYVGGKPLMRLAQLDPLRVEVILPSSLFGKIGPGMRADIKPDGHQESYVAVVTIVDRVIDPASNTFGVRLELPNPEYRLPSGLKCGVHFTDSISSESPPESKLPSRMRVNPKVLQQKSLHASQ
jgi:RND family efflux transporter MFP subunit